MSGRTRVGLLAAVVSAMTVAALGSASAHTPSDYYRYKWPTATVSYGYTPSVPSGWRASIDAAAHSWSKVRNADFDYKHGSDYGSNYDFKVCSGKNGIHTASIDGRNGVLGVTYSCLNGAGQITSFNTAFDSGENWYTSDGTPGSSQPDLISVATHELGHGTGFGQGAPNGHFSGSICTANSDQQTMCPAHTLGTKWQRSLEKHDKHTFNGFY